MSVALSAPADRLAATPKIRNADDVRTGLQELAWLKAIETQIAGESNREITAVKARHEERMIVPVGRKEVAIVDRAKTLAEAIEAYCLEHRDELLTGDLKSREFSHGEIGFRKKPASLDYVEGKTESGLLEWAEKESGIVSKVAAAIAKIPLVGKLLGGLFFDVKLSLNKSRVKRAREQGQITDQQLRAMGLRYDPGQESFFLRVGEYVTQREADA